LGEVVRDEAPHDFAQGIGFGATEFRLEAPLMGLAEALQKHVPQLRSYQPLAATRELRRVLLRELDFSSECCNLETFARNFAEAKTVHSPTVYPELCSRRVLTIELLEGIPVTRYEELHASGIDLNEVALCAADMYLEMIFRDGLYHADPHAGNFMVLPGGVVGVLDFGMVGRIDEQLREPIDTLLVAVGRGDSELLMEWASSLGRRLNPPDRAGLQSEVSDLATELVGQSIGDMDISAAIERMTDTMRRCGLMMPPSVLAAKAGTIAPGMGAAGEGPAGQLGRRTVRPSRWHL
jgi:ubiquinone biosynthesis protein